MPDLSAFWKSGVEDVARLNGIKGLRQSAVAVTPHPGSRGEEGDGESWVALVPFLLFSLRVCRESLVGWPFAFLWKGWHRDMGCTSKGAS